MPRRSSGGSFGRAVGPVVSHDDGTFSLTLDREVREALIGFLDQMDAVVTAPSDDERLMRLHPPAYTIDTSSDSTQSRNNESLNEEWQSFMREELVLSRSAALKSARAFLLSLDPVDEATLHSFATTLNTLRLVLGTILGIDSDDADQDDFDDSDLDDPDLDDDEMDDAERDQRAAQYGLYEFCGWLLEWTVDALAGELPQQ